MEELLAEINRHIAVLNDDYTQMAIDVAVLKSQMSTITWIMKTTLGAFLVLLVSQFYQIVLLKKSNKPKE